MKRLTVVEVKGEPKYDTHYKFWTISLIAADSEGEPRPMNISAFAKETLEKYKPGFEI